MHPPATGIPSRPIMHLSTYVPLCQSWLETGGQHWAQTALWEPSDNRAGGGGRSTLPEGSKGTGERSSYPSSEKILCQFDLQNNGKRGKGNREDRGDGWLPFWKCARPSSHHQTPLSILEEMGSDYGDRGEERALPLMGGREGGRSVG